MMRAVMVDLTRNAENAQPALSRRSIFLVHTSSDITNTPRCRCMKSHMRIPSGICLPCPPGFKRGTGVPADELDGSFVQQEICIACKAGDFSSGRGSTSCLPCPPSTVSLTNGQKSCMKCPRGLRAQTVPGLRAGSACVN